MTSQVKVQLNGKGQTIFVDQAMVQRTINAETIADAVEILEDALTARTYEETHFYFQDVLQGEGKESDQLIKTYMNRINKIAAALGVELGEMKTWNNQGYIWNHHYIVPIII